VGLASLGALKVAKDKKTAARGFDLTDPPAPGSPEFGRLLESLTGSSVRRGNRVEVLRNGDQIFPAMVHSIRSAKDNIDFSTYIYWAGGETIAAFGEALVERACAGVQVSILLDAVGSAAKMDRELVKRFREAGHGAVVSPSALVHPRQGQQPAASTVVDRRRQSRLHRWRRRR